MRVAVIGAGGWGTALASLLVTVGHHVCLWVRRPGLCERLAHERENALYLPEVPLPRALAYTSLLAQAVTDAELVVLAVPSHAMRAVTSAMAPSLQKVPLIVSTTKGIEEETLQTMSAVLAEVLGEPLRARVVVLSGPSFAAEVACGLPTAVTAAAITETVAA